jgi:hypothetical protein
MDNAIITASDTHVERLIRLVTDGLTSDLSRVMYKHALTDFIDWYTASGYKSLSKAVATFMPVT